MRGHDLSEFLLLAFGGAGPLHAARIAKELGMAGVVVPLYPGVYSAMGLLMSDVKHDYIRSRLSPLAKTTEAEVAKTFAELEAQALRDLRAENFRDDQIGLERALDMRYAGQGYEITIPCEKDLDLAALRRTFDDRHKQMFGHTAPEEPVEIVSYRLRGIGRVPPVKLPRYEPRGSPLKDALRETRKARFAGTTVNCPIYQRDRLDVGHRFDGPAIIDQLDATTVVPPGHSAGVDDFKNILITVGRA